MGLRYQEELAISFDMVDVNQEIKLSSFISYCLTLSGRQSEKLGCSDRFLFEEYGLVWVVTDCEWQIARLPRYGDRVRIVTEAISHDKFFCYRKSVVYDEVREMLLEIQCYLVLLDFEIRKISPVLDDVIAPYQAEKVRKVPHVAKYGALKEPASKTFVVNYFDLDMNHHVNNGKYLEWFYESLDYSFLMEYRPRHIHLKFIKEIGSEVEITSNFTQERLVTRHEICSNGVMYAQGSIQWEKRDEINR